MDAQPTRTALLIFEGTAAATAGELRLYRACAALNVVLAPVLLVSGWPLLAALCALAAVYGYAWLVMALRYPLRVAWRYSCPLWRMARMVVCGWTGPFRPVWRLML